MSILQTIDLKKYYGTEPNITRALDGVNSVSYTHLPIGAESTFTWALCLCQLRADLRG